MFRLLCSALVAGALLVIPVGLPSHFSDRALAESTDKTEKAEKTKATKKKAATEKATKGKAAKKGKKGKKRELTTGQKAARERQRKCGQEWQEAKKAGKVGKDMTWPKYWSACNTRLKGKST